MEVQHLFRSEALRLTSGIGYFDADRDEKVSTTTAFQPPLPTTTSVTKEDGTVRHTNLYAYSLLAYPNTVTWTIGASGDFFENLVDRDQFNPKLGITWNPWPTRFMTWKPM